MSDHAPGTPPEPIPVATVLAVMLDQLAMLAWQRLGLRKDDMTGNIEKDLNQAKLAIDVIADLANRLEPALDADDQRSVQNLVRDLRLNFVEQSRE